MHHFLALTSLITVTTHCLSNTMTHAPQMAASSKEQKKQFETPTTKESIEHKQDLQVIQKELDDVCGKLSAVHAQAYAYLYEECPTGQNKEGAIQYFLKFKENVYPLVIQKREIKKKNAQLLALNSPQSANFTIYYKFIMKKNVLLLNTLAALALKEYEQWQQQKLLAQLDRGEPL